MPEILAARAYFAQDKLACSEVPSSLGVFLVGPFGREEWMDWRSERHLREVFFLRNLEMMICTIFFEDMRFINLAV